MGTPEPLKNSRDQGFIFYKRQGIDGIARSRVVVYSLEKGNNEIG